MQDPYTVLGVNKSTGQADLKKTYRKLAMKLHPDQNPGDDKIAEKFKEVLFEQFQFSFVVFGL